MNRRTLVWALRVAGALLLVFAVRGSWPAVELATEDSPSFSLSLPFALDVPALLGGATLLVAAGFLRRRQRKSS